MKYQSTRNKSISVDAAVAINRGISEEGGLFVPSDIPKVSLDDISSLCSLSYCDRASQILSMYLTDYAKDELEYCAKNAYSVNKFGSSNTAPVVSLSNDVNILELWHGPTCAFKDMALQILPYLLKLAIRKNGEDKEVVILVATSGDTGKAALEGFKDVEGTKIQVFYPVDGVSDIQKLQMTTQDGENVSVCAVKGNFDDAQTGVKKIFTNNEYKKELSDRGYTFSSANSINWGRLVPQIVYYFSAYCDLVNAKKISCGDKINTVVPTGNFGNILAAYYALEMGLPVNKLICASNSNNVLTDFINTGIYDRNRKFFTTHSPSMDILISSNLERLIYKIAGEDSDKNKALMQALNTEGKYEITDEMKEKLADFEGYYATESQTAETIKALYEKCGYVIDTHTAVAACAYNQYKEATKDEAKTVIASTASPFKFTRSVMNAIDEKYEAMEDFALVDELSKLANVQVPNAIEEIRTAPVLHKKECEVDEMPMVVKEFLGV